MRGCIGLLAATSKITLLYRLTLKMYYLHFLADGSKIFIHFFHILRNLVSITEVPGMETFCLVKYSSHCHVLRAATKLLSEPGALFGRAHFVKECIRSAAENTVAYYPARVNINSRPSSRVSLCGHSEGY